MNKIINLSDDYHWCPGRHCDKVFQFKFPKNEVGMLTAMCDFCNH